jgi:hypothetical protein
MGVEKNFTSWSTPQYTLATYARAKRRLGPLMNSEIFKSFREECSVALMLFGLMKLQDTPYWLQPVDPQEQTPDVRTARVVPPNRKGEILEVQEVEVVNLTRYSPQSVAEFLMQTKLAPTTAYPATTTMLCHIEKPVDQDTFPKIHQTLSALQAPHNVFLLLRTRLDRMTYELVRILPNLDMRVEFDLWHEIQAKKTKSIQRAERLSRKQITGYELSA